MKNWLTRWRQWWQKSARRPEEILLWERGPALRRPVSDHELVEAAVSTAYYCAGINARAVARVPLRLYVTTATGQRQPRLACRKLARPAERWVRRGHKMVTAGSVDEVLEHPLLDLLDAPHTSALPGLTRHELLELTQLYLEITGRAYWQIESNGLGLPAALWLLPAQWVQTRRSRTDARQIDGYDYTVTHPPTRLAADEVVSFRTPDLADPYAGGFSPLRAAWSERNVAAKHLAHQEALLDNQARPDAIISSANPDRPIGDAEARRLETYLARYRSKERGGIFVARDGLRWDPIAWPASDLALLQEKNDAASQIARAFDIPLALLHRDANRANMEESRRQHAKDAVLPRLCRLRDILNARLVPLLDPSRRLFFEFDNPVSEDLEAIRRQHATYLERGVLTIDEVRSELGWAPLKTEN